MSSPHVRIHKPRLPRRRATRLWTSDAPLFPPISSETFGALLLSMLQLSGWLGLHHQPQQISAAAPAPASTHQCRLPIRTRSMVSAVQLL